MAEGDLTQNDAPDDPAAAYAKKQDFRKELESLINMHSMENGSDTPDFILANYLAGCLNLFDQTLRERERWYGRIIGDWNQGE